MHPIMTRLPVAAWLIGFSAAALLSEATVSPSTAWAQEAASAKDQPGDTVMEKLQGRWQIVGGVNQGRELLETDVTGTTVTVTTNSITTYDSDQQQRFRAVFTVDESKEPIQVTLVSVPAEPVAEEETPPTTPTTPDVKSSGIVKFDGEDQWTLCYALPGAERPEKFASPKGSKVMLFQLKRIQTDQAALEALRSSGELAQ